MQQPIFLLFIHKHISNRHIKKIKKTKTEIHITVVRCKATIKPEIKIKRGTITINGLYMVYFFLN